MTVFSLQPVLFGYEGRSSGQSEVIGAHQTSSQVVDSENSVFVTGPPCILNLCMVCRHVECEVGAVCLQA